MQSEEQHFVSGVCLKEGSQSIRDCVVSTLIAFEVLEKSHPSIACPLSQIIRSVTEGVSFLWDTENMSFHKHNFYYLWQRGSSLS